ncbi:MAG: chromate efflux transporter [Gammaproteobacteria bacterium]
MQTATFAEALAVWWRIGLLSFGGPAGQIALMHRIIVEQKKWLSEARFLHALNYCMLLPGPEAQQLATYVGWLLHGVRGGVAAGLMFVLPGALAILAFSWVYVLLGDVQLVEGLFLGLKAAVIAIVVQALIRMARSALQGVLKPVLAVAAFLALFAFALPFPLVVLSAGIIGYCSARWPGRDLHEDTSGASDQIILDTVNRIGTGRAALLCLLLWMGTIGVLSLMLGNDNVYTQIATFFSKMAMVTFGGAYAVLAYVAQQGVETFQWLRAEEMLDGLGLAETTPGPLILVTQFVGFLAAYRDSGLEPSLLAATLGAALTTWVTFLPCFFWIFAGAPYVERLRGQHLLSAALAAITAAVVGVIANLSLWFAINAVFPVRVRYTGFGMDMLLPEFSSLNVEMLILSIIAFVLVFAFRIGILPLLGICSGLGAVWALS